MLVVLSGQDLLPPIGWQQLGGKAQRVIGLLKRHGGEARVESDFILLCLLIEVVSVLPAGADHFPRPSTSAMDGPMEWRQCQFFFSFFPGLLSDSEGNMGDPCKVNTYVIMGVAKLRQTILVSVWTLV
jgi:hypothetical protein